MNKIILIFSLVVLVFSCQMGTEPEPEPEPQLLERLKKSSFYNAHPESGGLSYFRLYNYDSSGRFIREYNSNTVNLFDENLSYSAYEYDSANRVIRNNSYILNGALFFYFTYEYNSANRVVKTAGYYSNETLRDYQMWEYSDDNLRVVEREFDANNLSIASNIYEYALMGDGLRNPIKRINCNNIGICSTAITFHYDSNNLLTVRSNLDRGKYHTYEYDSANRLIRRNIFFPPFSGTFSSNGLTGYFTYEYERVTSFPPTLDPMRQAIFWENN